MQRRPTQRAKKWALLIGINDYPHFEASAQLQGAVNDVVFIQHLLLSQFHFSEKQLILLRNEQGSREGILRAFQHILARVEPGDSVLCWYSGHGSQMTDREGDEPSGYDQTLVPYDSGRFPNENRDITNDEIYLWLLQLSRKTDHIALFLDSCHTGTLARDTFGGRVRRVLPDIRLAHSLPPSPIALPLRQELTRSPSGPSGWLPLQPVSVLLASCRAEEQAIEVSLTHGKEPLVHGAWTYALGQTLAMLPPGATYRDLYEQACLIFANFFTYPQHPQMEGNWDRPLFATSDAEPLRFVSLSARTDSSVKLAAGAAHGLTVGSLWDVYPQNTKSTRAAPRLGQVEISRLNVISSEGRILNEQRPGSIKTLSRAVETAHHYANFQLSVRVVAPAHLQSLATPLLRRIQQSPFLTLADQESSADLQIYLLAPRPYYQTGDPVPQLGAFDEPFWAVVDRYGLLALPPLSLQIRDAAVRICYNLEKMLRYQNARGLTNYSSPLVGNILFRLKRYVPSRGWQLALPAEGQSLLTLSENDQFQFEIVNRSSFMVYIHILDFGLTGTISQIYPVRGAQEQLLPGGTLTIGGLLQQKIKLSMPPDFPFIPGFAHYGELEGEGTFKLFATTTPIDLSPLLQESFRGLSPQVRGPNLLQLLSQALTGRQTSDALLPIDAEWTSVEQRFLLRRGSTTEKGVRP